MKTTMLFTILGLVGMSNQAMSADPTTTSHFKKVITVVLENTDYTDAMKTAYMGGVLSKQCAGFSNFHGEGHPSQGNYIAMTSGSTQGVSDDGSVDLKVQHIGNLLEAKGLDWKSYAEDYPGKCFKNDKSGYVRKHSPFISYTNVQSSPAECAKIVPSTQFDVDAKAGTLPAYSFYSPNLDDDGHDTDVNFADAWVKKTFSAYLADPAFMADTLFVITFDEDSGSDANTIYTLMCSPSIVPGTLITSSYNHYNLLRTVEDEFGLGTFGLEDAKVTSITGIWKTSP